MPQPSKRTGVIVSMLTLYTVWSTTYLAIKVGLEAGLPPTLFAAVRGILAGGLMFLIARIRRVRLTMPPSELRVVSIVGILLLVGGQYGTFLAEMRVPSGLSALIVALLPLWIALAESLLPDMHRPSTMGWVGLGIGFAGLGVLMWPRLADLSAGGRELAGIGTQIAATWLWAAGSIYSKRRPVSADGTVVTAWEMLVAGVVLLLLGSGLGEWPRFHVDARGGGAILYLVVFGSCIAFTAFHHALANLSASKVMTYAYVNPVLAVGAGWLAGRAGLVPTEGVDWWMVGGMAIIVSGVAMTTLAPTRPPRTVPSTDRTTTEPLVGSVPSEV